MRIRAFIFAAVAVITSAPSVHAQTIEEMARKLERMEGELENVRSDQAELRVSNDRLRDENLELRERLDASPVMATPLEQRINSLIDSPIEGTVVNSVADPITISGHFRFRFGFMNDRDFGADYGLADDEDDRGTYVDARMNLAFDFAFDEDVSARFELMAVGLFDNGNIDGAKSTGSGDNGDFGEVELYQGYVVLNEMFGRKEMGMRIGRGEIALGREFQFGNNDFYGGRSFDALLWWWATDDWSLTSVFAKLDTNNTFLRANHPYPAAGFGNGFDDDEAIALWFTLNSIENHVLDVYYFYWNGERGLTVGSLGNLVGAGFEVDAHVFGARIGGLYDNVAAGLDWNLEAAYQTGGLSGADVLGAGLNGDRVDVDGLAVEAEIGITFDEDDLLRLFVRFLFAEGPELSIDGSGNVSGDSGYVPLYPERHSHGKRDDHRAIRARYGLMDIIPMTNVLTVQAGITFNPADDWTLGATGLYAWRDESVTTTDGRSEDGIGFELDLFAEHRVSEQTTVGGGFGIFFPDEGAPLAPSPAVSPVLGAHAGDREDEPAYLFYLQARVDF